MGLTLPATGYVSSPSSSSEAVSCDWAEYMHDCVSEDGQIPRREFQEDQSASDTDESDDSDDDNDDHRDFM